MQRKYKILTASIAIISSGLLLTACHPAGENPSLWGSYKCMAISGNDEGHASTGWATNQSEAQANAMAKCRERSVAPNGCHISGCSSDVH